MSDKIILTEMIRTKIISKNKLEGYGQLITIANDGFDVIVRMEPYDPVMGVQISWNSSSDVWITPPTIPPEDVNLVEKNMDAAVQCIEELRRRFDTLVPPAPSHPF